MAKNKKSTSDAVDILHRRYYEGKPKRIAQLEEARANDEVARKIQDLRTKAGLSQRELAKLGPPLRSYADSRMRITKGILLRC